MFDLQVRQLCKIPEGIVGQHSDLVVAQISENEADVKHGESRLKDIREGACVFYLQSGENPQVVQPLRLDRLDVVHVQIQLGGFWWNPAWNLCKLRPRTSHHRTRAITLRRAVIVT